MDERAGDVAELYREHPYPDHGVVSSVVARMLVDVVRRHPPSGTARPLRVLDVGCGTGEQTCGIARVLPHAEVTGIDPNQASIERARGLAARHGLGVRFECADVFDDPVRWSTPHVIVSIGVLHHLADPEGALQRLAQAAAPGAALLGMVYGHFGHQGRARTREALDLIAGDRSRDERLALLEHGGLASNRGPAHYADVLHRRLRYGPSIRPLEAVRRLVQGRSATYQADCYTHPLEATFTVAQVAAMLEASGWRFGGWPRRSGLPDRPEQVARGRAVEILAAMPVLDQAAVYERLVAPPLLYFVARRR